MKGSVEAAVIATLQEHVEPLRVSVRGEGRPIALIGGGLTGWKSWEPHADRLSEHKMVARVQPMSVQYGLEDRLMPEEYSVRMESAALAAAFDTLGWNDPIDVVAWSYGGLIALDFALDHKERIRSLTLIEPPAFWVLPGMGREDPGRQALLSLNLRDDVSEADLEAFLNAVGLAPDGVDLTALPQWPVWVEHRRSLRTIEVPLMHRDDPARLSGFDRPVLLVTGTGTAPFLRNIHAEMAERLPRVRAVEMLGGHAPHIVSMDAFLDELESFHATKYAVSADGTSIAYSGRGRGPAVLFVHGTTADRHSWARASAYLENDLTIYSMDRRGRGLSGDTDIYNLAREAEDVAAVVDAIDEPVILFGHSYGGLCALEAVVRTRSVRRLVLYEPYVPTESSLLNEEVWQGFVRLLDDGRLEEALMVFLRDIVMLSEEDLDAYRKSPLWEARIPLVRTVPRETVAEETYVVDPQKFSDLEIPVIFLAGSESRQAFRNSIDMLRAALPASTIIELPGQQHVAHHDEPELFARAILKAVSE